MKKILYSMLLFVGMMANAQRLEGVPYSESKWTFGGGGGIGFSTGNDDISTSVYITPQVGYLITEDLEAGILGNVALMRNAYYKNTIFGGGPFVNYYLHRKIYLSGMYQHNFNNIKDTNGDKHNIQDNALYIGGGYIGRIGDRLYMKMGLSYNILNKSKDDYSTSARFLPTIGIVYGL